MLMPSRLSRPLGFWSTRICLNKAFTRPFSQVNNAGPSESTQGTSPNFNTSKPSTDSNGCSSTSTSSTTIEKWEKELKECQIKYHEVHGMYLMCLADMENLRVRTRKEVENAGTFSLAKFAKDLLSVVDVLEMALEKQENPIAKGGVHAKSDQTPGHPSQEDSGSTSFGSLDDRGKTISNAPGDGFLEGVKLTFRELLHVFRRFGVEPFDDIIGKKFDPNLHVALFQVPKTSNTRPAIDGDVNDPVVIQIQKKGYWIKDRILRPAEVGIAK